VGDNTDGAGFLSSVAAAGVVVTGAKAVVLGAGGAARAIIAALGQAGAGQVTVVNRTAATGGAAAVLAGSSGRLGDPGDVAAADLVVNATPVGMAGTPGAGSLPAGAEHLRDGQAVVDLVYHPVATPFLIEAARRGATVVDGVGMLVHQAARQFENWTGREAPIDVMTAAARAALGP
jgi:shikimate dehydrogenase